MTEETSGTHEFGKLQDRPWLRPGDKLFTAGDEWQLNAWLNYRRPELCIYADGYRRAAEMLIEAVSHNRVYLNFCIYPIVFLYHHHVELQLKYIIDHASRLLDRRPGYPSRHGLLHLWRLARQLLEKVFPEDSKEDRDLAEELLKELDQADPTSLAFRYPVDKTRKPLLPPLERINILVLKDTMTRLANYLDTQAEYLTMTLDQKREYDDWYY